ncbi:MAG: hypothetical protein A2017_20905 [Lentisphaerae bacterium GWF2_44_16]|nr:MAG: hypothetical protein A2017_20905 [Lentisphaerae bacterium GWF2_44_16]
MNIARGLLAVILFGFSLMSWGGILNEGNKPGDWQLEDSGGKVFKSEASSAKVLMVNYLAPEEADMNSHVTEAMEKAVREGVLSQDECISMAIIDCKASWKPNCLIREFASSKIEKYKKAKIKLLFDYNASLRNNWGFEKGSSNIVIFDRNGICRAVIRGRVPEHKVNDLLALVRKLQNETNSFASLYP